MDVAAFGARADACARYSLDGLTVVVAGRDVHVPMGRARHLRLPPAPANDQPGDATLSADNRDVLSPREVAERSGFSYHAILRAIRRGDLRAFEPVPGHYRIELSEYDRWLRTPARRDANEADPEIQRPRRRTRPDDSDRGSFSRLSAIESGM